MEIHSNSPKLYYGFNAVSVENQKNVIAVKSIAPFWFVTGTALHNVNAFWV